MASPAGLQLFLGRRLPDEVLQRIFEFGWKIWLAKPHDVVTEYGQVVMPLVRFKDIKPDVYVSEIWREYDEELDEEFRVEKRWSWSEYYEKEYLENWICADEEEILGLARPIVRKRSRVGRHTVPYNGEGGYHDSGYYNYDGSFLHCWHFRPVHFLPRKRRRRHGPFSSSSSSSSPSPDWDW